MKANQAPIYRATERLLQWSITATEVLPKSLPMQNLGNHIMDGVKTCMDAVILALQSDSEKRVKCIEALIANLTFVRSAARILSETRHNSTPVLSRSKYAQFIELTNSIDNQASAWLNKTAQSVRHQ